MSCASESNAIAVLAARAPSSVISGGNLRASAELSASCDCLVVSAVHTALSSGIMRVECIASSQRLARVRFVPKRFFQGLMTTEFSNSHKVPTSYSGLEAAFHPFQTDIFRHLNKNCNVD